MGRLHIPGGIYHVIGRGFERRNVFAAAEDKRDFLHRLEDNLNRTAAQCLAWALMSNHFHLLIRIDSAPLAKLMAPVLSGFASYYNRSRERSGYVFQNRFQSILCEKDSYFLELVRYIHLNPLRAGLIQSLKELDSYSWTGHSALMGKSQCTWLQCDEVLGHFDTALGAARRSYRRFIASGIDCQTQHDLSGGGLIRSYQGWEEISKLRKEHVIRIGDERILGSSEFVESTISQDRIEPHVHTLRKRQGWNFDILRMQICQRFGVTEEELSRKVRGVDKSDAKTLLCYWAVEELGLSVSDVAQELRISQQAVSKRIKLGAAVSFNRGLGFEDLTLSC